ncbi:hypothetical protein QOZ80_3AG0211480 [Eleusine coracana subsp. coracana]|nr:hypothetical protein QOZ80_3AG0211480 [Eleusine coracana subsp. coracana]
MELQHALDFSQEKFLSDLANGSQGCGEDDSGTAATGPGEEQITGAEQQKQEDRTPKIQRTSISEDARKIPWDDEDEKKRYKDIVRYINRMYGPMEGFDWDDDTINKNIDHYLDKLKGGLPDRNDSEFWVYYKETQLTELNARTRSDELEDESDWYFDPIYSKCAHLEDYQRLMLRNYGEYEEWEYYSNICNTLEADQQFVQFWEKLQEETKWLPYYVGVTRNLEYIWSVRFEKPWLDYHIDFYHQIWKLVAKDKMDFKEALRQVYKDGRYYSKDRSKLKAELNMLDSHGISNPGPVHRNYEAYFAKIGGEVTEGMARKLISDDIDNIVSGYLFFPRC